MKYFRMLALLGVISSLTACQKEEYKTEIPESGVSLLLPAEGDMLDLNREEITSYTFSWDKICEGGNTLIISASPVLKDLPPLQTVAIEVGDKASYDMTVMEADACFAGLGIGGGKSGTLYWTVKPTDKLSVAATEIRSFTTKRIQTELVTPEDQTAITLNVDTPDEEVFFSWKVDKDSEGTEYQLCFGLDGQMSQGKVVTDAGNAGEFCLTHQQLQDILEQLPFKPYVQNNIYWNVIKKADGSMVSRSSHIIKMEGMLIFTDVRGDEKITYRVTKIKYSYGEEFIWLAENLRATKYPDGSDISFSSYERWNAPTDVSEGHQRAYGYYYSVNIANKVVPEGWKLPSREDYFNLVSEAKACVNGGADVIKHPIFWNWNSGATEYANAWGLGLVPNGYVQWAGADGKPVNYNGAAGDNNCYLLAGDLQNKILLISDWGCSQGEVYEVEAWGGAPVRLIYVGK